MGDAAHAGSLEHEVFNRPFKVQPEYESWDTPDNYRRFPGGKELPEKIKVWRIQKIENRIRPLSTVSRSWGYNDSPDAEALVAGFNDGKEYGAVGVGRHGNILQWGYAGLPSQMTPAGRNFFLNCICYISKFDGKSPLIRRTSSDRFNPVRLAMAMSFIEDKKFFSRTFSPALMKEYEDNWQGLMKYYQDDYEFIYYDKFYLIDMELKSLGIQSNRKLSTLEQLISMLEDPQRKDTARLLLGRYTQQSFGSPEQWQNWYQTNKDRMYFSDVGGYKFFVVPKGYLSEDQFSLLKKSSN